MILCGRLSSYSHAPKSLCSIVCTILSTFVLTISSLGTERDLHWKEEVAMCFQGIAKSNSDFHIILTNTPFDFNNEVVVRFPSETCEHFLDAHLALLGLNSVENNITVTEIFRTPVKIEGSGIKLGVVPELSSTVVRSSILSPMNSFLLIFVLKSKESDEEGPRALNLEFAEVNLDASSIQVHVINLKKLEAPPANGDASKQYYDIEIEVTETIDGQSNLFDCDVYNLNIAIPGATRSARVQNGVASFKAFPVTPAVNETLKAKVVLQNSFYIEESKPFVLDLLSPTQASLNDQLENLSVQILPGVEPVILGEPFELRVAVMKDNEQHYIPTLTVYLTSCSSCDIVPLRDLTYQIENRYYVLPDSLVTQRNEATQHCKLTFTLLMDNFSKKVDVYLNTQPRIRHELFGAFRNIPSQIISGEALGLTIELLGFKSSMDFTGFGIKLQATRSLDLQAPQCVVYDAQGNTVLRAAVDASGQALFPSTRIVLTSSGGSLQPNSSWPCPMQIDILDPNEEQVGETSNHHLIITMATDLKKDEQQDIVSGNKSDTNKTMVVSSHTTIIIIVVVIVAVIVLTVCATSIAVAYGIYRQRRSSSYTLRLDEVNPWEMSHITSPRASRYSANTVNYNIPYSIPPHSTSSNEIPLTRGIVLQTSSQ